MELFNKTIQQNAERAKKRSIFSLFDLPIDAALDSSASLPNRADEFSVSAADLYLDYAKQNITKAELEQLISWAEAQGLRQKMQLMFSGEKINNTEQRAVLHTALRAPEQEKKQVLGEAAKQVEATEQRVAEIVDEVQNGQRLSASGEKFTDVLAIGIGGSYYGIKVGLSALQPYHCTGLKVHVIANVDGSAVTEKLNSLNAATTLVVIISKTFTTQETLLNAKAIKTWMLTQLGDDSAIAKQWFAISSNVEKAQAFGLESSHVLPMWDWVGGRFSVWSAVGLPLALAIGIEHFNAFKEGAYQMDKHFQESDFCENMPVLMALLGLWNRNGLDYPSLAVLPYDHALRALPGYLQQTDMESNGKSVSNQGEKLAWKTAPIVFGQEGTNGQHAFMQLMHQSDEIIPTDFIVALQGTSLLAEHHKVLVANCFAQSEALMQGKNIEQVKAELANNGMNEAEITALAPHKTMKGNTPSSTLLMESLTPKCFGAILALYEHKIFVQGMLWQVNSYDQWGVELGKQLSKRVLTYMEGGVELENVEEGIDNSMSSSSLKLITLFLDKNK
ncbi:glucose-6-phosphate isomerase [Colwellia sp. 6_MG-2023]|uniref:glucose-6-phosphate isomerase n=1 Tax=Colwellia sp. 6_MG-2023 TaxID=3062676 RepID=UPI0026E48C9C|nr:glucose-6-phosphate isomerase [Colwellia sp. 6_MG-2023]MDO6489521.1 glucose-6-phosphate isomerase [Colwellia sp. 6_MG-2023]